MGTQHEEVTADLNVSVSDLVRFLGPDLAKDAAFVKAIFGNPASVDAMFASTYFQQKLTKCITPIVGSAVAAGINR